ALTGSRPLAKTRSIPLKRQGTLHARINDALLLVPSLCAFATSFLVDSAIGPSRKQGATSQSLVSPLASPKCIFSRSISFQCSGALRRAGERFVLLHVHRRTANPADNAHYAY